MMAWNSVAVRDVYGPAVGYRFGNGVIAAMVIDEARR